MRLLRFDNWATGILLDDGDAPRVLDVAASLDGLTGPDRRIAGRLRPLFDRGGDGDWSGLIAGWDDVQGELERLADQARQGDSRLRVRDLASVRLRPPLVSRRARVFACGANFADHTSAVQTAISGRQVTREQITAEKDGGLPPWGFTVLPETVVTAGDVVTPPPGTEKLDYEAEVAVVAATGGRHLAPESFRVWGYTGWNDFSIRDPHLGIGPRVDRGPLVWALQKNFDTGNACGPWLVVDDGSDVADLRVGLAVNGQARQDGTTADMLYSFSEVAAHLSRYLELLPGDMFVSGTPAGTALESGRDGPFLREGDRVDVTVQGVGTLTNWIGRGPRS